VTTLAPPAQTQKSAEANGWQQQEGSAQQSELQARDEEVEMEGQSMTSTQSKAKEEEQPLSWSNPIRCAVYGLLHYLHGCNCSTMNKTAKRSPGLALEH